MISLGENYKHSGLIPLKSLGVLPFISMGALPSPYNGCSHLSAGIDAVLFALAATPHGYLEKRFVLLRGKHGLSSSLE